MILPGADAAFLMYVLLPAFFIGCFLDNSRRFIDIFELYFS